MIFSSIKIFVHASGHFKNNYAFRTIGELFEKVKKNPKLKWQITD